MSKEKIELAEIQREIEQEFSKNKYPELPVQFENFLEINNDEAVFLPDEFDLRIVDLQRQCEVHYDIPIRGRLPFLKRFIKRIYGFHMKQLWEMQNGINKEMAELLCQVRNYIHREHETTEQLKKQCDDYEKRIRYLEELVKKNEDSSSFTHTLLW